MENENGNEGGKPNEEIENNTPPTDEGVNEGGDGNEGNGSSDDGGSVDFDPSAFSKEIVTVAKETDSDGEGDEGDADGSGSDEGGEGGEGASDGAADGLDWVTDEDEGGEGNEDAAAKEAEAIAAKAKADEVKADEDGSNKGVSAESFKQVADALGLKFETLDEMKEHLQTVEEENNKLRTASGSGAKNEAIEKLESLLDKSNEDLVRLSLEKDGFSGGELDDAVDKYVDNGMIDIEAKKIRSTINNAIVGEQNKVTQSTVDADAKQQQEHAESVRKLEEHIGKTDTMFGFKMAKDPESLKKVQQGHAKYITSGKFLDEVFANDESLAEVAWFTRNKKVIISAIANKNLQKGKQAILDDIRQPEVENPQRFKDPSGSNEFDPKKFGASK